MADFLSGQTSREGMGLAEPHPPPIGRSGLPMAVLGQGQVF